MRTKFPRSLVAALAVASLVVGTAAPVAGRSGGEVFPSRIDLPAGFRPEGIAVGRGSSFYAGSLRSGALYKGDLRTGSGGVLYSGTGGEAVGLAVDSSERIFVAGGPTGEARVVDGSTGELLAIFRLTTAGSFVNDVVIAGDSAWFTDSVNPVLYRVPLDLGTPETIPLTGDFVPEAGFNANGIEATPDGGRLVLVQSNTGEVFSVDPSTGVSTAIDLGGETVPNGDGILLQGHVLTVVQNRLNQVAVIELSPDLSSGTIVRRFSRPEFDVPTTVASFGNTWYFVNARFTTPPTLETPYWITAVRH